MHLTSDEQGLLLAGAVGFMTCVALLHLSEITILAARLRAWMALWCSGMLLLAAVVLLLWWISLDVLHGVRFADLLIVFGGQLGLLVCLPSRWLSRRKCRWDRTRTQLELQEEWRRQASDSHHPQQRSRIVFPGYLHDLSRLGQRSRGPWDSRHAGAGPRVR
jgi:hypothetical protein